jgi:L-2,4-diaminobutyrate decarboxylase
METKSNYQKVYSLDLFKEVLEKITPQLFNYLDSSTAPNGKVLHQAEIKTILSELDFENCIRHGNMDPAAILPVILKYCNRMHSPHYIGHQVAVPMVPTMFADFINGITNNAMPVYEMGPAGSAIERGIISWMLSKAGWKNGDGVLTHGGSLANLTCLLAARARAFPDSWKNGIDPDGVIMASAACHYSISKMTSVLGLGSSAVISVPTDKLYRIRHEELEGIYQQLKKKKKKIMALVVNDCVTATGVYDPINKAAQFCKKYNIWLHVDGAHGAAALVSEKYRGLLQGIEDADSLTWDTHKMLGTSALCGAALFKKKQDLDQTFIQEGSYLFTEEDKIGMDISQRTLECTKSLNSLKLFFNLAFLGEKGIAEHIDTLYQNSRIFHQQIESTAGFSSLCSPEANVICFSYGQDSALQDKIRQILVNEGDFYITRASIANKSYLRLSVMNPATTEKDIKNLCKKIVIIAEQLQKS